MSDAPISGRIVPRMSWPRPATPTGLVPVWAGEFRDFQDWVNFAAQRLTGTYDPMMGNEVPAICIDSFGRRCTVGGHFRRAQEEGAFPVRFFWDCEPARPALDGASPQNNDPLNLALSRDGAGEPVPVRGVG